MKKLMRVFFRTLLCSALPVSLLLGCVSVSAYTGNSTKELTSGADIRVMSYNVLVDNDESIDGWSWGQALGNRGDKASAAINYYRPDVIGFQECNYKWHVSLRENLPDYDFVNADVPEKQPLEKTESLGKKDWMCTTMMYNTKTLELVHNELIGYTVNYWGCIQRMRYISMAVFKVKKTGEKFVFTSTHLDAEKDAKGDKMRKTQANELANRINHYKDTYGYPVISTGDFNKTYNDEPLKIIREKAGMDSYKDNRGGIDYVLYSQGVSCKYFTVVRDSDLNGASDHQPIFADLSLGDGFHFPTTQTTTTTATTTKTTTTRVTTTTTIPTVFRPTKTGTTTTAPAPGTQAPIQTTEGTSGTTAVIGDPIAPSVTDAPIDPTVTDAPVVDTPTDSVEPTTTTTTSAESAIEEDEQVEADIVKKGNDKLIYIGIAAAVVAVGAVVAFFLLRKKK